MGSGKTEVDKPIYQTREPVHHRPFGTVDWTPSAQKREPADQKLAPARGLGSSRALSNQLLISGLLVGLLLLTAACTKQLRPPENVENRQAKSGEQLKNAEIPADEKLHIAPPPAYGNKVVMAKMPRPSTEL
ncbi:MAG: hypothetical protein MK135_08335 [Polyangiaceae bacterium]|nr:hypothetical protein [Polyangiaceae bacterium]